MDELSYLSGLVAKGRMSRRDFLGRSAALGVGLAAAGSLLSTAARAQGPVRGGTIRLGMQGGASTDSLDPGLATNQVAAIVCHLWGETLVWLAPDGSPIPVLAEGWSASPDAKTWTFKIRKGVQFHNGKTLTPEDVVATLERHSDASAKSGALGVLKGVETIKADGETVVITLKEANADMPFLMSDYHLVIQPGGAKDNPEAAIGTGPYKLAASEAGVRYNATRFEDYWDRENAGFAEQVEVVVINDATARIAALQGGQVHMINRIEPKTVSLLKNMPRVTIRNISGRGFYPFNMFCDTAPFDNKDLRLALKYAMDRETMIERILRGYGSVGNDTPINKAYPLYEEIEQRAYDPEKAAFHFKKSGHDGAVLLRTSEVAFPGAVDAAVLYQESAKKAGIAIEVKREPGDGYWSNVWNVQPFSTSYWGGRPTQDQMYSTGYISSADWNDTRFKNEAFDKMVVAARAELDETKRRAMYRDMSEMMRDEGGLIAPMFNDFIDGVSANIQGWVDNPAGELMNGDAPLRCWLSA
ncbi:ABC transporter substrate-binding protein [Rhizobium sp. YJ-22]|uniref:ABC transporter substrate-binding protein n=1 Tax=Rhizobium sp. YJ-22 TaxID=3037556 RepID=UPI0024123681|nr:ABC transporter substrate-binding protein [Rhizobium sp. YJ-22]MDG3579736.1 ABC transporter substrate-binding protein [Rhizobium sp. YJ-22]